MKLKQDWSIIPLVHLDRAVLYLIGTFFLVGLLAREINLLLIIASAIWMIIGIASKRSMQNALEKWGLKLLLVVPIGTLLSILISQATIGIYQSSVLDDIEGTVWAIRSTAENWGATFLVIYGLAIVPFKTLLSLTKDFRDIVIYGKKKIPKRGKI
ncbi:MAG: hypothetical protein AMQ74_01614 [Candidatus Methanofastidiosum methylothiophilum]|uniref:Uncharacterized protein n=1 Tax=Candidatus Methanofastidiosum methylothiophilum TaxID=1705564 RepID=A0A150ITJ3_9EURY|nr:MAG: hypothetical protein AMQ74_01614 [Candidatus Methanofastidiosum methylthiophilus]